MDFGGAASASSRLAKGLVEALGKPVKLSDPEDKTLSGKKYIRRILHR